MTESSLLYLPDLYLAWTAYLVITLSPGPANLAVMATSMAHGRRSGLALAAGVILGSQIWGILAALGLSALLTSFGWLMEAIRILGAIYLLWLASLSLRSAMLSRETTTNRPGKPRSGKYYFLRGLAIHLTNPKAVFGWLAIISVGTTSSSPGWLSFLVVAGCFILGVLAYSGYAVLFSTPRAVRFYLSCRRYIEGVTVAVFGVAGIKLLFSRS